MQIKNNNIFQSKTMVCKPLPLTIIKRNMWKATGNTVSTRFLDSIENPLVRKKILYTISYLLQNYGISSNFDIKTKSIILYQDTNKDVITLFNQKNKPDLIQYKPIFKEKQYKLIYSEKLSDVEHNMGMSLVNFLANEKEIPTDNITRLILLQKIFPKLCISRGLIYEYASQWEKSHYFPNDYVSDKIAVENAFGLVDINYMSELIFTFDYLRFLQKNLPRLQIKHALSLHTTNKTSIDGIESYKQTNQYNCDLKLILLDINTQNILTIYLDIKQTEGSSLDYQSKYLKLLYKNNPNSIENYLEYANDTYFDTFSKKMPFNYLIDKNIDIFQRLNSLHEWLLINSKENNINCTLVYTKKINEEIILNEDDDYNQINKDMFLSNQAFNTSMNRLMNAERKVSLANIQEKLTNHKALIENIGQTRSKYFPEFAKDDYHDLPH